MTPTTDPAVSSGCTCTVENRASALKIPNAALRWRPAGTADTRAAAPTDAPVQQTGGQAVQQFRARITAELKPSDAQKAQIMNWAFGDTFTTCRAEGFTGTKLTLCQQICEVPQSPLRLSALIKLYVTAYREDPPCAR